jgi:hypothetical protein
MPQRMPRRPVRHEVKRAKTANLLKTWLLHNPDWACNETLSDTRL